MKKFPDQLVEYFKTKNIYPNVFDPVLRERQRLEAGYKFPWEIAAEKVAQNCQE